MRTLLPLVPLLPLCLLLMAQSPAPPAPPATAPDTPPMYYADASRLHRPYSKDPSVIKFKDKYLMYFSIPPFENPTPDQPVGWNIGIAESTDLLHWKKIGEMTPDPHAPYEAKGLCAPGARVLDGKVHLFYQTYGNFPNDAICHASSDDGLTFTRDPTNPIFHPPASHWSNGRAIDAEVVEFQGKRFLYCATRDPKGEIQMITGAVADPKDGLGKSAWKILNPDAPLLKPELPWEQKCIEAPSICVRGKTMVMFYAGAYNNAPQQIGVATSTDGITWTRSFQQPFLPNGKPGTWNSSESGHPGIFTEGDSTTLFFQGNNDQGKTWLLSQLKITWKNNTPQLP